MRRCLRLIPLSVAAALAVTLAGCAHHAHHAPARSVSIVEPVDGATVTSPFRLRFGTVGGNSIATVVNNNVKMAA